MIQRTMVATVLVWLAGAGSAVRADVRLHDICRVKGQEANTLTGIGLVVGLRGTGDGKSPTALRKLARVLEEHGNPVSRAATGEYLAKELQDTKNVALVAVSVRIPPAGAQVGTQLDCTVTAIAAKSLAGGVLLVTALQGRPGEKRVYAIASGTLTVEDTQFPTVAKISQGARMLETFETPFQKDDKVTLVLRPPHANFPTAYEVEEAIARYLEGYFEGITSDDNPIVAAKTAATIEVRIPEAYRGNVVQFIAQLMELRIVLLTQPARVTVNERAGTIVITGNVQIGPVVVSHRNLTIDSRQQRVAKPVKLDSRGGTSTTSIDGLIEALDTLQVPTSDQIAILRQIAETGQLYGELIDVQ